MSACAVQLEMDQTKYSGTNKTNVVLRSPQAPDKFNPKVNPQTCGANNPEIIMPNKLENGTQGKG